MRVGIGSRLHEDMARLFERGSASGEDRGLLDRFRADGDQAAFAVLVERHGPMVLGVCRRRLGNSHDADDAFQATVLVLVRNAGRLRDSDRLGPWLYGVASRVSGKAQARKLRRRERPPTPGDDPIACEGPSNDWVDVKPVLDAELARVSTKLRDVVVLCLLEGLSAEEASDRLGCPIGTVKSRLARGREALRDRLTRRGVSPAVGFATTSAPFTSPLPATLVRSTLATITGTSPTVAPGVATLIKGVAPAMISKTTVVTSLILGGITLAGLGAATWVKSPAEAQQPGASNPRPAGQPDLELTRLRKESRNHLKQILLAFHNYHSDNDHFPAAASYGADGQPKLSWRVAILPYLEEGALYNEFRQDEPWDSPHNKALVARMPAVFRTPESPTPDGQTRLRGFVGKGAMFEGTRGIGFQEVIDGTSNTVLIASAREPIVWTRPGELPFVPMELSIIGRGGMGAGRASSLAHQPLPLLDNSDSTGVLVAMADGSTCLVQPKDEILLRAMITRNGGEVITLPMQPEMPAQSLPPSGPTPYLTPEQRLQRLEEKVDRILQKLDSQAGGGKP